MISSFVDVFPELNCVVTDKDRKSILARIDFDELLAFAKYHLIDLSKPDENDPESLQKFKKYFEDFGNDLEQEEFLTANINLDKINSQPEIPQ